MVVVGASAAGLASVESFRRAGFAGELVVVGEETCLPYDRPPLSKQVLGGQRGLNDVLLRAPEKLDSLQATWRLGRAATALDVEHRTVELDDGEKVAFDGLVIATGARARRIEVGVQVDPITIRTFDDALRLGRLLGSARSVAVIGAGFLGTEIVAAARARGLRAHLVDPLDTPLQPLGGVVGSRVARLHESKGVALHLGRSLVGGRRRPDGALVLDLDDGNQLTVDVVVTAVGARPNVEWLAGSGVELDGGVVCDEYGEAASGVVAAGDVASWWVPELGRHVRTEHRLNATEQGVQAALTLLGRRSRRPGVPLFWTDQFDTKIQVLGYPDPRAVTEIESGDVAGDKFVAIQRLDGTAVAVIAWNSPAAAARLRPLLLESLLKSSLADWATNERPLI